jgi:hypothetical protein
VAVRHVLLSPGHDLLYPEMRARKSIEVTLGSCLTTAFRRAGHQSDVRGCCENIMRIKLIVSWFRSRYLKIILILYESLITRSSYWLQSISCQSVRLPVILKVTFYHYGITDRPWSREAAINFSKILHDVRKNVSFPVSSLKTVFHPNSPAKSTNSYIFIISLPTAQIRAECESY